MNFLPQNSSFTYTSTRTSMNHRTNSNANKPPGEDWTAVHSTDLQSSSSDLETVSGSESLSVSSGLPLASPEPLLGRLVPNGHESDSSTTFDPQAWKQGHEGTGRSIKTSIQSRATTNPINQKPQRTVTSNELRRTISHPQSRRGSAPQFSTSSSKMGWDEDDQLRGGRVSVDGPRWRPYIGPTHKSTTTTTTTTAITEQSSETLILDALATLGAMSGRSPRVIGWNTNSSDGEADDARPIDADIPTSPINSSPSIEDDDEEAQVEEDNHRWWNKWGDSLITLNTWQIVGISGLVLGIGIGIGAGGLMSTKLQRVPKLITEWIKFSLVP